MDWWIGGSDVLVENVFDQKNEGQEGHQKCTNCACQDSPWPNLKKALVVQNIHA